jgi:putative sterol carrier protein
VWVEEPAVARFLSPSWIEEFNSALDGVAVPGPGPDSGLAAIGGRFTVVQEIKGTPDGDVRLVLGVDGGSLRLGLEPSGGVTANREDGSQDADPDVSIAVSYEDAAAMSRGDLAPAEALNAGRIRVRGDLSVLVAAQQMLVAARGATQALVSSTTY